MQSAEHRDSWIAYKDRDTFYLVAAQARLTSRRISTYTRVYPRLRYILFLRVSRFDTSVAAQSS